jgi:hypothetical protein
MSLRQERNNKAEAILEGKFITYVLEREASDLDQDIKGRLGYFTSSFWQDRSMAVNNNTLTYLHLKQHRYVDMRTRDSLLGKRRKHFYNVHNRPLYGHANEIVKELTIGFTQGVKDQLMQMDGTEI